MSDDEPMRGEQIIQGHGSFSITPPQPTDRWLVINGPDNEPLVTVLRDGTIEFGPNYTPDAVAKVFWSALAGYMPRICDCEKRTR